ncbi:MAG: redoxin domain-containing protein [Smithellaceae bacterium]|nr:redoxin domain-containing protein [Smithellaceae bacterium]
MARIQVGDVFGDFSLKSHTEAVVDSTALAGKKILLSFHPLAWTELCAKQMQSLEVTFEAFRSLNTVPLGFSVDSVPCKKAWAISLGIEKVDLLADFWPHGGIAAKLGIFIDKFGFSERANIILDEQRKAIFVKVYPIRELPDVHELLDFLKR